MAHLPDIEHRWAIEAMVRSYNHVYQAVHHTTFHEFGPVSVSDYGNAPIASFQLEFLAMDDDPMAVVQAIKAFGVNGRQHALDVFHGVPSARELKKIYAALGYDFVRTGPILGLDLSSMPRGDLSAIQKVETYDQAAVFNRSLAREQESIPMQTLGDPFIHNFVAVENDQAVGWVQLVTASKGTGYINQLYVLTGFRKRRIGSQLMMRAHMECMRLGGTRMALVSSDAALGLYRRLGYRPVAYFTVFRPANS